jgi:exopolysaccharide production protein ExoQ
MSFSLASVVCIFGIAGLFYLDRDRSSHTSKALWLPVIWLWIVGSRPVSVWLGVGPSAQGVADQLEGSPIDAFVFIVLMALSCIVLSRRKATTWTSLTVSLPIIMYFSYCLISTTWSPYSSVAFKRWIKDIGDLSMALIVVTDADLRAALDRLFSRIGFVLLPASVLLIRYSDLGRGYDPDGYSMNTGVTTNKNTLGLIVFIISLGALWNCRKLLRAKKQPNRTRRLVAQGTLLTFGIILLWMAHSATSVACFALGALLILATGLKLIGRNPKAVHALFFLILLSGGLSMIFGGQDTMVHALGRKSNFTGRTEIWKAVIPAVPNAVIGAGFESFWISPSVDKVWHNLSGWFNVKGLNTAHNGYIEIYLNLGLVGLFLIALILVSGYRNAVAAFRRDPEIGGLMLAYVATVAIYSVTEAGFRMLTPTWIFLLLAVIGAGATASGLVRSKASRSNLSLSNEVSEFKLGLSPTKLRP